MARSTISNKIYTYGLLGVLMLTGLSIGTWDQIITPTLPDLKDKLNVSYESMGRMKSIRSMGSVVTLLIAGYLYDSFPMFVPYMMVVECFIGGLVTIIIPWCSQYWLVACLFFIQSGMDASLKNGGQLTVLTTFKDKAMAKLQIYHLGYGIGGLLAGLISQPFLPKKLFGKTKITKYCQAKLNSYQFNDSFTSNVTMLRKVEKSSFEYIYLITGLVAISASLIYFSFVQYRNPMVKLARENRRKQESWLTKVNPKYIANGNVALGVSMTILLYFYYFLYVNGMQNYMTFIVVYAIDPCKAYTMDQKMAAYLHAAANGCFLAGRILNSLILNMNPTLIILFFNSFNIVFVVILLLYSNTYVLALWIGTLGMRLCDSLIYPSGTGYINRYIIVTSTLISIAFLGSNTGESLGPFTGGILIDNYPSFYIIYMCLGSKILLLIVIVIIVIIGKRVGQRDFSKQL